MRVFFFGIGVGAAVVGAAWVLGVTRNPAGFFQHEPGHVSVPASADRPAPIASTGSAQVKRFGTDELVFPAAVVEKMGIVTAAATAATHTISLPSFQGVLALDNDRLSRVHARFGGEVVEIGKSTDGSDPTLHVGERVQRGDLLAVVWSTDLGQKKSDLVDAMTKLRAEEQLRDRLKKLFESGAGAGRVYRDAEKDVQIRLVEIASLERTLRTWRVTNEDLEEIKAEAGRVEKADELAETTMSSADAMHWARVEVRAPITGVVLEKNLVVGDIVGNDTDLFKIGDLSQMAVWAHVYEEDLPLLESLSPPIQWLVTLPSQPGVTFPGTLEKIGAVIDPTQHTALATGHVRNPSGNLKIGQFVNVTVQIPPPELELELPAGAVVENARQSVVFVRPTSNEFRFIRRPVTVVRRFRDFVYVGVSETGVQPGSLVVTAGALMLQNLLDQLPAPVMSANFGEVNPPLVTDDRVDTRR